MRVFVCMHACVCVKVLLPSLTVHTHLSINAGFFLSDNSPSQISLQGTDYKHRPEQDTLLQPDSKNQPLILE